MHQGQAVRHSQRHADSSVGTGTGTHHDFRQTAAFQGIQDLAYGLKNG